MKIKILLAALIGILTIPTVAFFLYQENQTLSVGGGLGTIEQLDQWKSDGTNITQNVPDRPLKFTGLESSGDCLVTDINGVVSTDACGSGGASDWNDSGSFLYPKEGDYVQAPYFISTSTTVFNRFLNIGTNYLRASSSAGIIVEANSGSDVADFGAGGGTNASFYGGVNIDGQTRIATSITGLLQGVAGVVSATTTGTFTETVTGLELSATRSLIGGSAILSLTSGYNVSLTASTTNWNTFYNTPSNRITAGTGIDWTGNTLNGVYTAGDGLTLTTEDFDCDTASGSVFGCLTSTDWNTFNNKQSTITFGTGVQAALGVNIGSAGAPVLFNGALGTPTSGTVTNLTGTASININGTVGATTPTTVVGTTITGNTSVTSPIHSSNNADPADAGIVRLGNAELIAWEASPAGTDASLSVNSSEQAVWTGVGAIIPSANDGFSLGISGTAVSDLFLASGGVINWNAGNSTITHTTSLLTSNVNFAVPDNAYAASWNASTSVPTKNAVYDIIETLGRIAGQIWTGVHDFGGATSIEIVNGTGPTVDTTGEIALDTTDNQLLVATGTAARAIPTITKLWGGTVASTSVDFASGGRIPLPPHRDGVVITEVHCYVDGGTSKVINLDTLAGGAQLDSLTCGTTLTSDTSQSANYSLSAGALMALEFGATSGTVDYMTFSAWGYIKPE